jgi:catecholate siderophore receptor
MHATVLDPVHVVDRVERSRGYVATIGASATKTATPLVDVPQSVTVINRNLITDLSMQGLGDVVRYVPGIVMAQGEGNRDQPIIRGYSTSADLYVNAMRDDIQFVRDLYNIERVDFVSGASAMIFGRGNGGGVINRITKQPTWTPIRELSIQGGSFDNKRATLDFGQGLTDHAAARLNGLYENSGYYRDDFRFKRYGVNPTLAYSTLGKTPLTMTLSYERFNDHRTADRGVPSFSGRPFDADVSTFFGDPHLSYAEATVDAGDLTVARVAPSGLTIRNHARWAAYDKIYQNVYPGGAVNAVGTQLNLSAYNNAATRHNLFNQTDVTFAASTGSVSHTLLVGTDIGRQVTNNLRNTGYFNDATTSLLVSVDAPNVGVPVTFRQNATDANNRNVVTTTSVYAQDQVQLTSHVQLVAGLRAQRFDITYHNNRGDTIYTRTDNLLSPRAGIVVKPRDRLAFYTNYGVSYLPSSGDQFSSLTSVTKALEPEKFTNVEIGTKWLAMNRLTLTTAVYRLDRTNTRAPDPVDPTRVVQTGKARTSGVEVAAFGGFTSRWQVAGTYTNQTAKILSRTANAIPGATPAIVPHTIASLWNKLSLTPRLGVGLGATWQSDMYAAVDNTVRLRGYSRFDAAAFYTLTSMVRAQVNVDNVFDQRYFVTADNNNNITPGSPRSLRMTMIAEF